LRELAAQELQERVHLKRKLVKKQQQNLLLQKQNEINRLAQADKNLLQQRMDSFERQAPKQVSLEKKRSQNTGRCFKRFDFLA